MNKKLERDLGLYSVIAISVGAMVGSGIFILPGLAYTMAGPSVVLAYLVASVLVLPAAVSKSEMATAMPEAGGTYLYVERAMGPLLGTVAGVGTWFSLTFKSALALIGGAPYLVLVFDLPIKPVAVVLAFALVAVNIAGVKQTGLMQIGAVAVMLAVLLGFIVIGFPAVECANFENAFADGAGGLVAASGFVFVSYAGVTKVASVAEEVEDPERNIPLGMLASLALTTLIYVLIVFVTVGVLPGDAIDGESVAVALAADVFFARFGVIAVIVAALLALVSTANAGLLSSSRYPFAMSRDELAPAVFETVHDRFNTPTHAITLTGAVMLLLILFVPIREIAKLASAFKIVVFAMTNLALIAFRESETDWYDPSFRSPLYPWLQAFGVLGGVVLLTQMGTVPIVGAALIILGGCCWYYWFAYGEVDREGAMTSSVRRSVEQRAVETTETAMTDRDSYEILVALREGATWDHERTMVSIASDIARKHDGQVKVVWFERVPDQTPLEEAAETRTPAEVQFERQTESLSDAFDAPIDYGEIVSHDTKRSIVNFADHEGVDAILLEQRVKPARFSVGDPNDWILRNAPCDVFLVDDRGLDAVTDVAVLTERGPYDPAKIRVADAIATESGATVSLLYRTASDEEALRRGMLEDYHASLRDLFDARVTVQFIETAGDEPVAAIVDAVRDSDLLIVSAPTPGLRGLWADPDIDEITRRAGCTTISVFTRGADRSGPVRRLLERWLF